jgi:hypothetical protein
MKNKDEWLSIVNSLATEYNIDLDNNIIVMYFEWCGDGIQKKTALTGTSDKMAIIFSHFKVEPIDDVDEDDVGSVQSNWFETKVGDKWVSSPEANIFNINDFPTYEFTIDFNKPLMVQNEMISLVKEVIEPASPVGKKFGFDANIGEGIVVTFIFKDRLYKFKVKGEAHTTSKVKTLNRVDDEKLQKIQDIAQKVSPVWRLEQMFDLAIDALNGGKPDMTKMGDFIRLISNDIIKEEIDIIIDAGLEHKTIMPVVSTIARQFFKEKCLESE